MYAFKWCDYFGFLFLTYCVVKDQKTNQTDKKLKVVQVPPVQTKEEVSRFSVDYHWHYLNFTWPSYEDYKNAFYKKRYIPENNAVAGIKFYKDKFYLALPRLRRGTPVTLAYISANSSYKTDPLLTPFPSWEMNVQKDCSTLQNVQSMEIDRRGMMWVLDGNRFNNLTKCPPKLVLLDLNGKGTVLQTYEFPNEIVMSDGGFMNDLVVDESDGGYAYITDNSPLDPGIIVFSRLQARAWKLRDSSMFAELEASEFSVDGVKSEALVPVDGIALAPPPKLKNEDRYVFYSALAGYSLYAISNKVLKNEELIKSGGWRREIKYVGKKQSQSDGFAMDNKGNLYYGLLSAYGIAKWNINSPFSSAIILEQNKKLFVWPDSFCFDSKGNLYVLVNGINRYFDPKYSLKITTEIRFRILRTYVAALSYLYN